MKDIAAYAVEALLKAGADKAACSASQARKDEFNVEENKFTLLRTLFDDRLHLKAIIGGRKGEAVVNKHDRESIDKAVADCAALAAASQPDDAEDIAPKEECKDFDQRIGGADMAKLFSRSKEFLEQVGDEFPKIKLGSMTAEFNSGQSAYLNSNGAAFATDGEHYGFGTMFTAKDGEKSSSFNGYGAALANLDAAFMDLDMHRALLGESVRALDARALEGKFVGKVIVTPACEDMIWHTIIDCFLSTVPMIEGTSRWKDALGTQVADAKLTFRAAPLDPRMICAERFTRDGFESRDFDFIKDGILKSFALPLYAANKTGKPRAANTAFGCIEVAAGDAALEEMIKGVDRGVLLNRFSGAQPSPSGEMSGVAKNSFLIENGKVTDALSETMVSFNIADAIKSIPAISRERVANGGSVLPWVCLDGITVSGK